MVSGRSPSDGFGVASQHQSLSYQKFDNIAGDGSDDEVREKKPMLHSDKSPQQMKRDNEVYEIYKAYFKKYMKGQYPLGHRKLLARFVAIQDRGVEKSNIYRYADIIGLSSQRMGELMHADSIPMLCELHKRVIDALPNDQLKEGYEGFADGQRLLEAINTLEAIRTNQPPTALFESLCYPTSSDSARKIYEKYERKEFAKDAMMRVMFGDIMSKYEEDENKEAERHPKCCGVDVELCQLLGFSLLLLACLAACIVFIAPSVFGQLKPISVLYAPPAPSPDATLELMEAELP